MHKVAWVFAGLLLAASAFAAEPLVVGVMGPITGAWASEGQDMRRVVELLAKKLNDAGGVRGRQIKIEVGDDGGDPRTAALAAQLLVSSGAIAVVGTYGSSITEASQGIYDDEGILQIATGSTAIRLSEKGFARFFRTCPRDDEQGRVLAKVVIDKGFKAAAVLHDNSSYAKGLADETTALLQKAGLEPVFFDAITQGDRDFTTTLVTMKSLNPDISFSPGTTPKPECCCARRKTCAGTFP